MTGLIAVEIDSASMVNRDFSVMKLLFGYGAVMYLCASRKEDHMLLVNQRICPVQRRGWKRWRHRYKRFEENPQKI